MKRRGLASVIILGAVAVSLTGCNRSDTPRDAQADRNEQETTPATETPTAADTVAAFTPARHSSIGSGDVPLLEQIDRENTRVVAAAVPSLVRITSQTQIDPHSQLLGFPFHLPGMAHNPKTVVPSYGSGVIISRDGYIVTNFHVIRDARSVNVQLHDKRDFPARVLAADQETDVAVLKIDATDLQAMPWGDSDKIAVGQQVFAIGNPFNLDTSVSKGIISGLGRNLPEGPENGGDARPSYEDYLQTDAAINMGNSGGALINIRGELVGINAAIASFTQGSEGVGFSIPSNLVRSTVEQLIRQGHLVRGYLGVRLPSKIDDGVAQQLGLDSNRGALLAGIQRSSPADLAKLKPVDCIVDVDGHKIDSPAQFRLIVAQIPVGKQVVVDYIRAGAEHSASVRVAELPKESEPAESLPPLDAAAGPPTVSPATFPAVDQALAGVQVGDLNATSRQQFGVDDFVTSGVVVTAVQEGSLAETKGLLRGDVIEVACAQRGELAPLAHSADFSGLTHALKPDQTVVLLVHHGRMSGGEDRSSTFLCLAPPPK